jgi:serine O-acetyltransferase
MEKDRVWPTIREEVKKDAQTEDMLASYLNDTVLAHSSIEESLAFILANKLHCPVLPAAKLRGLLLEVFTAGELAEDFLADLLATYERDPACKKYSTCLLYFKGFHAMQTHRVAHFLHKQGRAALAAALHSRSCMLFDVDIHPAARIGKGTMIDHATGVVIGETTVVGDNVSLLHQVTLGGSGKNVGDRHPKIGSGVMIGAGAVVLGNIQVGNCSKIGCSSVVLSNVPPNHVAVGVPAKIFPKKGSRKGMSIQVNLIRPRL